MVKHRFTLFHLSLDQVPHTSQNHASHELRAHLACTSSSSTDAKALHSDSTSTALTRDTAFKKAFHTSVDHSHLQTMRNMLYVAELWFPGTILQVLNCIKCSVRIQTSLNLGDAVRMHLQLYWMILMHSLLIHSAFSAWVLMGLSKNYTGTRTSQGSWQLCFICLHKRGLGPFPKDFTPKHNTANTPNLGEGRGPRCCETRGKQYSAKCQSKKPYNVPRQAQG